MIQKWSGILRRRSSGDETSPCSEVGIPVSREDYDRIVDALRRHVVFVSNGTLRLADVLDDVNMYDAGYVDSVGVTEFMIRVSAQYDLSLPDWKIGTELKSLRDVACYIMAELKTDAGSERSQRD